MRNEPPYPWMLETVDAIAWPVEVCQFMGVGRGKKRLHYRIVMGRHPVKLRIHMIDRMTNCGLLSFHELSPLSDGRRHWMYYPAKERTYVPEYSI